MGIIEEVTKDALVEEMLINSANYNTARQYTVVFPFGTIGTRTQVLLGLKKRGMGVGLWNGFGGKIELGETFEEGAHRELKEECGLSARAMKHVGVLLMKRKDGSLMTIYVYTAHGVSGCIAESDEMEPKWFDVSELPYDGAYKEARLWWPAMLSGKAFVARFVFSHPDNIRYSIEWTDDAAIYGHTAQMGAID
ncbi:hypothetical protein EV177_006038 [Coemansia sp. RSA 1804]|nr:hypothetical protein EV177_006038 [Coemansia sp. RSA 1804]